VRYHDVSGLLTLIRASFIIFVIVCKVQLSVNSVICLISQYRNVKLLLYYFYTYIFILFYVFPVIVLDCNFAPACGPGTDYP
jgi:hypothetical protein